MCTGIFLSLLNGLYFRKAVNVFGEFVPQILFMLCLFGYMCFLIIWKWCWDWKTETPPLILNVMISMFLSPYKIDPENHMFDGQLAVQIVLLLTAIICIPWMLLAKPYVLKKQHKEKMRQNPTSVVEHEDDHDHGEHGEVISKSNPTKKKVPSTNSH
jgi:V-type H+-transporting ATPase subunit a